ncbi:MAG: DUF5320 domain-containing protein [Candidatus Eisenbacteria bacterium]|nr:DUF5320 domain-containing protein [Candidatus Eisenbacteria bacterium]
MSCCETGGGHGMSHGRGSDDCCCCCGCGASFHRRFISRKEEREMLERYRDELKLELQGLEERLKELGA